MSDNRVFSVRIRFMDDGTEQDVLITDSYSPDELPEGYGDDDIFFFGMREGNIRRAIETGEPCENEWFIVKLYENDEWGSPYDYAQNAKVGE